MEFFGQRAPPPPRHTSTRGRYSSAPPPYESESRENDTSPTYTSASDAEPTTLAKYMFRYGFRAFLVFPFRDGDLTDALE
jgi:hypothetical protein